MKMLSDLLIGHNWPINGNFLSNKKSDFTVYKSRRVPFSLFVNIPLTTPRINFRISECHHRFSIDLIVIFSAKNGKLFLDHTDPLRKMKQLFQKYGQYQAPQSASRLVFSFRSRKPTPSALAPVQTV